MPITPKLNPEELALHEIIRHPVFCSEFLRNIDIPKDGKPWELAPYQVEMLCDHSKFVSLCCGRIIGKCFHKDTKILNPVTGEYRTVEEWYELGLDNIISIDETNFKQKISTPLITDNGYQNIVEIETTKGFKTKVTYEHPFLTNEGWEKAKDLKPGTYIALPNRLEFFGSDEIDDLDLIYLAHFIAEGLYKWGAICTTEQEVISEIYEFASINKMEVYTDNCNYHFKGTYRLGLLEEYGLRYCHSYDKFIPKKIFELSKRQIAIFLNRLFGDDGWCYINDRSYEIGYATTSEQLARDIQHLLLRFGISASLGYKNNNHRGCWWISIRGRNNCQNFSEIGFIVKRKQEALNKILDRVSDTVNQAVVIPIPTYKNYHVLDSSQQGRNSARRPLRYYPTYHKASQIIDKDEEFHKWEKADIQWLKIKEIKFSGLEQTYSIEVSDYHTLVADDIYSHNSETILDKTSWYMLNNFFPHDPISIATPNRVHLEPLFSKLRRWLNNHTVLKHFVSRQGINASIFNITAKNGFQLDCRIAGTTGGGANVIGLHAPVIMVDEASYFPWGTWIELQPTLNIWIEGAQMFVSGVPTGQRDNNVLYYTDQEDPNYTTFNIPQQLNPRYTDADEVRNQKQFGGVDSEDYIHLVLGRHGTPVYALFSREKMKITAYDSPSIKIMGAKLKEMPTLLTDTLRLLPDAPAGTKQLAFGVDLGYCYSEDTEVLTNRGWLRHKDILLEDIIACYDTDTNKIKWNKPKFLWEQNYKGIMLEVEGKSTNFCVSPEHSVWASKTILNKSQKYEKLKAKNLPKLKNAKFRVRIAASAEHQSGEDIFETPWYYCDRKDREYKNNIVDMSIWLQFLAWFISEGSATDNSNWEINITQSKDRYVNEIDKVLNKLPYTVSRKEFTTQRGNQQINWRITCKALCLWLREYCGIGSRNKKIPDFVFDCSTEDQELFLRTLLLGDGSRVDCDRSPVYNSSSHKLLDQVQRLAVSLGYSATKSFYEHIGRVCIVEKTENQLDRDRNIKEVDYDGKIYCLGTTTGYYITRRKGKIAIQGNSEPTVIMVLAKIQEIWRLVARLTLIQVPYPQQQKFIADLDIKYSPDFIGIDAGGAGKPVVQNLIHDDKYDSQRLDERIVAVDFNTNVHVGYDQDGNELKERAKVYGMQQLQEMVNGQRLVFSSTDDDLISELERTVYSRSPSGNIIYRTMTERGGKFGDDHNVAALLSFTLAWFEKYDSHLYKIRRKKLWGSRWG